MSENTKIEWADASWNPIQDTLKGKNGRGYHCEKCSPGCDNCYAEGFNRRFGNGMPFDAHAIRFEIVKKELLKPYHWEKPRRIFVQSMGDIFLHGISREMINDVITVIVDNPQHTFIFLTKRIHRAAKTINGLVGVQNIEPLQNLQIGISVCVKSELWKIDVLRKINLPVRFVCFEPLLEDMGKMDLSGIQWVIVGGETGIRARPMHPDWGQNIWGHCQYAKVPFFFKSWGNWAPALLNYSAKKEHWFDNGQLMVNVGKKKSGRVFLGKEWNEMPQSIED